MDGLSQDKSIEMAKGYYSFFKKRLRIFSEKDNGIYDAMNKGIAYSNGSWLFFIGSNDVIYCESTFSDFSVYLQDNSNNVVYGNALIQGNAGWANDGDVYDGEFTISKIFKKNICHQAIFYRKRMFQIFGTYNINYPICADYDLNLRFFAQFKFKFVPITVVIFSGGGASTSIMDRVFFKEKYQNIVKYFNQYPYGYLFKGILKTNQLSFTGILKLTFLFINHRARIKRKHIQFNNFKAE
jgi:glycosyltransferase involved in cell wall biosynthesis